MKAERVLVRSIGSGFLACWVVATAGGALFVSIVDSLLLQRDRSFFTGGFLAVDYLTGATEIAAFLATSLLVDAAVVGLLSAGALWLLARARVRVMPGLAAAVLAGSAPLLVADVLAYELASYVGDLFDWSLAMDLAGGSTLELIAVSSAHLVGPSLMIIGAGTAAGAFVWLTNRYSTSVRVLPRAGRQLVVPALCGVFGVLLAAGASASSDAIENGLLRKPSGKVLAFVANGVTDVDGDGFGIAGRTPDPDLFNAAVFPFAREIPGNGLDENGIAGDLPAAMPPYTEPPPPSQPWARRPDVVFIVLESFRADLLAARQSGRPVTPTLNALAARGVSVDHAYSHNGYTAASRFHLFAGSLAGIRDQRTLIDDFHANGYFVAYFSGQDESFTRAEHAIGFERADVAYDARVDRARRYTMFTTPGSLAVPLSVVQERLGTFLEEEGRTSKPLFLYVNFHDTHFPYWHDGIATLTSSTRLPRSSIARDQQQALWATYANTAANVDTAIAEVLAAVRRVRGVDPGVIVTADHGESLFEEGFLGHGYLLNDVQTRIPLIVSGLPVEVAEPFGQQDLRDAIAAAMRREEPTPASPRVYRDDSREVFQYLGNLHRPRQIAFLRTTGRTIYDFRTKTLSVNGEPWRSPQQLTEAAQREFRRLVHYWERMMLARGASTNE